MRFIAPCVDALLQTLKEGDLMAKNKFAGVDDIYFTPKSICTVKVSSVRKGNNTYTVESKRYHPKNRKKCKFCFGSTWLHTE